MIITFPEDTKTVIDAIRGAIGRDVTFWTVVSSTACPVCSLDIVTNTSTDSFCETCEGLYWIPVASGTTISGHVTWGHSDNMQWESGGQWYEGDCRVQIEYTDDNLILSDTAYEVTVDDKTMEIKKKILRGVPDLNRILLDLIEKEK